MKNTLLLLLILTYSIANSQSQTRFGPSIGVFKNPDIKSLAVGFQVRREYLKKKDSTNQTNHIHITDRRSIIEAVNNIAKKEKNELLDS